MNIETKILSTLRKDEQVMNALLISSALDAKIHIGNYANGAYSLVPNDLSVVKISDADYIDLVTRRKIDENALYITEADYLNAYNKLIKNVANPTISSDAVTKEYVDNIAKEIIDIATEYTAIEVFPTTILILAGTKDNAEELCTLFNWSTELYDEFKSTQIFTNYEYTIAPCLKSTAEFLFYSNLTKDNNNVIIYWGDGTYTTISSDQIDSYIAKVDVEQQIRYYAFEVSHTYSGEYVNRKNIIKVAGSTYTAIRTKDYGRNPDGSPIDNTSIVSRVMAADLPIADNVLNTSSLAFGSHYLLKLYVPYMTKSNIRNYSYAFAFCKNLKYASIDTSLFNGTVWTAAGMFESCINLEYSNVAIPSYSSYDVNTARYFYLNCKKLSVDINDLLPPNGFANPIVDIDNAFTFCEKIYGTIPSDILWNCKSTKFLNTAGTFARCSCLGYENFPDTWGHLYGTLPMSAVIDFNQLSGINYINDIDSRTEECFIRDDNFSNVIVTRNKFDKDCIVDGYYFDSHGNPTTTTAVEHMQYCSQYIRIDNAKTYKFSTSLLNLQFCTYDKNKNFIERILPNALEYKFNSDVKYIRISIYNNVFPNNFVFAENTIYDTNMSAYNSIVLSGDGSFLENVKPLRQMAFDLSATSVKNIISALIVQLGGIAIN